MLNDNHSNYNSIDVMKFIMAVLVIAIHTGPFYYFDNKFIVSIFTTITQVSVPFFYIATGFFLGKKSNYAREKVLGGGRYKENSI